MTVRVVFADDNYLVREGVAGLLNKTDDIELLATVTNAVELHAAVAEHRPEAVLTDIRMPATSTPGGNRRRGHRRLRRPEADGAACHGRGAAALSGLMLAIWALGSLVSGVVTGAVRSERANAVRFRRSMLALAVLVVPLPFVHGFWALAACLFVSGFAISPILIASFGRVEEAVPSGRLTEGITLFTTALGAGLAPGAAAAGLAIDTSGASASYWVVVISGLTGAAVVLLAAGEERTEATPSPVVAGEVEDLRADGLGRRRDAALGRR